MVIATPARAESTPDGDLAIPRRIDPEVELLTRAMNALQHGRGTVTVSAVDPRAMLMSNRASWSTWRTMPFSDFA